MSKNIKLIIGSVRQGRAGKPISDWLVAQAKEAGVEIETIDLKEIDIPFFDSPIPPAHAPVDTQEGKAWTKMVGDADAFVFVTPEYNRSIPGSLKNAIDHVYAEWGNKPAVVVSYGFTDGGAKAAEHLADILNHVKIAVVEPKVSIQLSRDMFDQDGFLTNIDTADSDVKEKFITAVKALS